MGQCREKNKKSVLKYYGIPFIVVFILLLTTYTSLENVKAVKVAKAEVALAKKMASDKVIADKKVADKLKADKIIKAKAVAEKAVADKVIADKVIKDKADADKSIVDKAIVDKTENDRSIANEQKTVTTPTTNNQSTSSNGKNTSEIESINEQIKIHDSAMSKLNPHGKEYIEGLNEKQRLLQKLLDLSK
ncbi:hypothetical protein [Clostridium estertheticum]|uniref:hypothetical protein n=1 Tax=Clostridium estertheticum TaxID=238834 RepID=UPI001C6DEC03|nr:hypothetical protein [Clostridium estertheticum]MBW9154188.1 hypothetical protein [Clostridium estertheticum]WLC83842.1 hypothetical protein KTC97_17570 [Clostridium estertheticum]